MCERTLPGEWYPVCVSVSVFPMFAYFKADLLWISLFSVIHKQWHMLMLNMAEDSDTKVSLFQVVFPALGSV